MPDEDESEHARLHAAHDRKLGRAGPLDLERPPESAWEEFGHEAATDEEVARTTTSRAPLDLGTDAERARASARQTAVAGEPPVERQTWGAATGLTRERRRPPPGTEE